MKLALFCLIVGLILSGCSGIASQPVAFAYQDVQPSTPEPTPFISPTPVNPIPETQPVIQVAEENPQPAPEITPPPTPGSSASSYSYGPYYFPPDVNPLTGLPVARQDLLERRPIVIKVTNFPRSVRPQYGLSLADHVFEYYIGDSMSRFIGIFYGNDASRVGPIRSARIFDERVLRMYEGIFIFGWADDPVLEFLLADDIKNHLIIERSDSCPPVCRIGPKGAYNTLFADTAEVGPYLNRRGTNNDRQKLWGLRFDVAVPKSGNPGVRFYLDYSGVSYHYWQYDPEAGRYLRFQDTVDALGQTERRYAPLVDSLNGAQLAADNIIVLKVPHTYYYRSSSTEILDQPLLGEGTGFAFRNGNIYPITWSQSKPNRLLDLKLPNGITYALKPGTVWFEVIGETSDFELVAEGIYRYTFNIP